MIKVLIVDDITAEAELLEKALKSDPQIEVTGKVTSGAAALRFITRSRPDVVVMDTIMPGMDGFETTRRIMESTPLPVIIVMAGGEPGEDEEERRTQQMARALEAGAVSTLKKPAAPHGEKTASRSDVHQLVRTVKAMAAVRVVKRWGSDKYRTSVLETAPVESTPGESRDLVAAEMERREGERRRGERRASDRRLDGRRGAPGTDSPEIDVAQDRAGEARLGMPKAAEIRAIRTGTLDFVAVGASTGGPPVLQTLLQGLPSRFPIPILVVQHMTPGFLDGLCQWLQESSGLTVRIAGQDELPLPGNVYLAPDDYHMGISASRRIMLSRAPSENGLRPSVSYLFRSLAHVCPRSTAGVLLTGMGRDGAAELKLLRDAGALTFAQDEESSLIHGMPGEAVRLDAARFVLPPEKIAEHLRNLS